MRCRLAALAIIFILSHISVTAQNETVELGNVTITSSLQLQQQKETGRNITVIRGEHFRRMPVQSIDELLRYLPGVEVQQRGPQGSQSDINIRGGTFQQVLVIIDGVKLNDPLTGHFSSYIPIHPDEIERVEVLKGAASAVYGSEAVGGVINIITKTFAGTKAVKTNTVKAGISAGDFGLINGNAYYGLYKKNTQFSAGITTNNADGQRLRGTTGFFNLHNAGISFSQQMKKDWRISMRVAGDFRKFNAQNYYTTFASDTAKEEVNSWWSQLNLVKKTKKGQFITDVAYKKLRDQYWFRPASVPNDNKTNLLIAQSYYTTALSKRMSLTTGLQAQRKEIRSNDRGNHRIWHGALYTIFRQQVGKDIHLNESIRLDWDESYGLVLVPQLNFAWSPSKWNFRASAGRSIRDADFTERYNNYNKALVTSGRIGNPDLQAEESWNIEGGADYYFSSAFKISSTVFYRDHSGLIDWSPTPYANMPRKINLSPTGSYALARNVESVKTNGIELDATFNKKISNTSSLLFTLGYTWLHSYNKDSVPSYYISTHARHLVNFAAVYAYRNISFSVNGLYKERNGQSASAIKAVLSPSYFVLNAKLACNIPEISGRVFLQADNVFDKNYSDLLGSMMPGRWVSGGIDIAL